MAESYDAVVVGAGPNGLVAANLLADAGWSVVVLEASRAPRRRGPQRRRPPGARLHRRPVQRLLPARGGVVRAARDAARGARAAAGCTRRRCSRTPSTTGAPRVLSRDLDQTAASVDAFAAGDGDAWRRWVSLWREVEQPVLDALLHPFPPVRPALSIARRLGAPRLLRLRPHCGAARPAVRPRGVPRRGSRDARRRQRDAHRPRARTPPAARSTGCCWRCSGSTHGFPVPRGRLRPADRCAGRRGCGLAAASCAARLR